MVIITIVPFIFNTFDPIFLFYGWINEILDIIVHNNVQNKKKLFEKKIIFCVFTPAFSAK